jgi:hypothetical protein
MTPDRKRNLAVWGVILAILGLLKTLPLALEHFTEMAPPTKIYYAALPPGAVVLLVGAVILLLRPQASTMLWILCGAAAALFVNQAAGVLCNTIVCFGAG